jgi:hypothetical protein
LIGIEKIAKIISYSENILQVEKLVNLKRRKKVLILKRKEKY